MKLLKENLLAKCQWRGSNKLPLFRKVVCGVVKRGIQMIGKWMTTGNEFLRMLSSKSVHQYFAILRNMRGTFPLLVLGHAEEKVGILTLGQLHVYFHYINR